MDDEEIWKVIKEPVDNFTGSIQDMKTNIEKLITFYLEHTDQTLLNQKSLTLSSEERPSLKSTNTQLPLSPISIAKMQLAIVYAMNTCYKLCLVTHGQNPNANTDVVKEFERIKLFMKRAKQVEESLPNYKKDKMFKEPSSPPGDMNSAKRPRIDKEAAKRFCLNSMTLLKS